MSSYSFFGDNGTRHENSLLQGLIPYSETATARRGCETAAQMLLLLPLVPLRPECRLAGKLPCKTKAAPNVGAEWKKLSGKTESLAREVGRFLVGELSCLVRERLRCEPLRRPVTVRRFEQRGTTTKTENLPLRHRACHLFDVLVCCFLRFHRSTEVSCAGVNDFQRFEFRRTHSDVLFKWLVLVAHLEA